MSRTPIDIAMAPVLRRMLYFPDRGLKVTPAGRRLEFRDLRIETDDGERLHGWFLPARPPRVGHLLHCHGNAGNIGDRILDAGVLVAAGFDVLMFDYRGYGSSSGSPSEAGTYLDARAARRVLLEQPGVDEAATFYLGESLGGAIALELALAAPPRGLVLQSTFTSVRAVAHVHYPWIPSRFVPDAYPSLRRITRLTAPLLVLHGDADEVVPFTHGRELYEAAPGTKRFGAFPGFGHSDLVMAGVEYANAIADWARGL